MRQLLERMHISVRTRSRTARDNSGRRVRFVAASCLHSSIEMGPHPIWPTRLFGSLLAEKTGEGNPDGAQNS